MKLDTIRAWKDEDYRQSLSEEQLRTLPANPAGEPELTDVELQAVSGGWGNSFFSNESFVSEEFVNSAAFVCENPIFSNNHVRNVVQSLVNIRNICFNVN